MKSALIVAAILVAAPAARADEGIPVKARDLAAKGRSAHDQGDYARAIAAFKEAYVIAPAPALLFNLAQAYRLQGNCDDAALMYRRYISTRPAPEGRALAEEHLATMERCLKKRSLNIPMDESMAYLRVEKPPMDLGIVDAPVKPAGKPGQLRKDVGLGFALGGSAAIAIATYYGVRAHGAAQDVEELYAMGAKWKEIEARDADGKRAATIGKVFGIGGVAAIATGTTLYVLGKRAERSPPIMVTPIAKGAQVNVGWRF